MEKPRQKEELLATSKCLTGRNLRVVKYFVGYFKVLLRRKSQSF